MDDHEPGQISQTNENAILTEKERLQYLSFLSGINQFKGESAPVKRRNLFPNQQSLLYLLRNIEGIFREKPNQVVGRQMERLEKAPLSQAISTELGHRPNSLVFLSTEWQTDETIRSLEILLQKGPVYIKASGGTRSENIIRISKLSSGDYSVRNGFGNVKIVSALKNCELPRRTVNPKELFIAEEEIPIARSSSGETWELRILPPYGFDFSFVKISQANSVDKTLSYDYDKLLESVVRNQYPKATKEEIDATVKNFLEQAQALAMQVKELSDRIQVEIAQQIFKPEDFQDPAQYDEIMKDCFSGTFLTVDITGQWDDEGKLKPMIIEAQPSTDLTIKGIPSLSPAVAYEECLAALNDKVIKIQKALKPQKV